MISPAHRGNTNTATVKATPPSGCGCCSLVDLQTAHHVNMSRRFAESPLSSRNPRTIFTSNGSSGDPHEPDHAAAGAWSPRCYACSFCGRDFNSAQALGGHMNIHRRDRARLRSSTSLPSDFPPLPSDLPTTPQNAPKPAHSMLYLPLEAASRDNPAASISSSLSTLYPPPTIMPGAPPPFRLLDMRSAADPALISLAAPYSHENATAPFSAPLLDLLSVRCGSTRSSATSFFKLQNEALFSKVQNEASAHEALENSRLKAVQEARGICGGQASTRQLFRLDLISGANASGAAPHDGFMSGRNKRARGNHDLDAVMNCSEDKSRTVQRSDDQLQFCTSVSNSTENSNSTEISLHESAPDHRSSYDVRNELIDFLDLELRLGQSSWAAPAHN